MHHDLLATVQMLYYRSLSNIIDMDEVSREYNKVSDPNYEPLLWFMICEVCGLLQLLQI